MGIYIIIIIIIIIIVHQKNNNNKRYRFLYLMQMYPNSLVNKCTSFSQIGSQRKKKKVSHK